MDGGSKWWNDLEQEIVLYTKNTFATNETESVAILCIIINELYLPIIFCLVRFIIVTTSLRKRELKKSIKIKKDQMII